jgi:hypothetical protein
MRLDRTARLATPRHLPALDRVRCVRYYPRDEVLEVEFWGGRVSQLAGVPDEVYRALRDAPSPSAYFYHEVAGRFTGADRAD